MFKGSGCRGSLSLIYYPALCTYFDCEQRNAEERSLMALVVKNLFLLS